MLAEGPNRHFSETEKWNIYDAKIQFFGKFRKQFPLQVSQLRSFQFCAKVVWMHKGTSLENPAATGTKKKSLREWEMNIL